MTMTRETIDVPGATPIEVFRQSGEASGRTPGPVLAVLGGVHGDEPEGVFAANAIARSARKLERGTLVVVPIAHPAAFAADLRTDPDGGNLARVFPGDASGAQVERTAAALTRDVLAGADLLIDLHTAGRHYDMPLLAGYVDIGGEAAARARQMAEWFAADFVWRHPPGGRGRTLSVMADRKKPAIYTEAPGGGTLDATNARRFIDGVERVMAGLGMIAEAPTAPVDPRHVFGGGNMDTNVIVSPREGMFARSVAAGDRVDEGQAIGAVHALDGAAEPVTAPRAGHVMYLRRSARVTADMPLAAFAAVDP